MECNCGGHPVGMLDRDQRTAKICVFDRRHVGPRCRLPAARLREPNRTISQRAPAVPGRTSPHRCRTRRNAYFWKSLHRLKHALLVGACLWLLVVLPAILSAPLTMTSHHKWMKRCGIDIAANGGHPQEISDRQLVQKIVSQAKIVQNQANQFKESYVGETFKTNFDLHHNLYKDKDYDWLPNKNIPKELGQPVPESHLETLELPTALNNVYGYLQQIAVGMEQVVLDERERNSPFTDRFSEAENQLRALLCEILTAIIEKEVPVPENVSENIMGEQFKHMDNTSMDLRNWIIFRDYMNMVEYVIDVFEHFKKNLSD